MKRRLLSIITALALCLSLLPTAALAAEDDGYPGEEALNVQATTGSQTITVSWDALDTVNGDAVKNYTVYCYDDDDYYVEEEYTDAGFHTFDEGLTNGVTYYVGVTATYTQGGEDAQVVDAEIEAVPLNGDEKAPDAPTGVTATAGNGSVTVSWTAPESDGGAVITGYEVKVISEDLGNGATAGVNADTTTYTVDGLFGGAIYTVVVSAINAVGRTYSETTQLEVAPAIYDLWVCGEQVTGANADDVLGDSDEGDTVSYDPITNTLTLNNAVITGGYVYETERMAAIYAGSSLNLVVEGTSTVTAPDGAAVSRGIYVNGDLYISGSGALTAAGGTVDNVDREVVGIQGYGDSSGIAVNDGSLCINGCSVEAIGGSANGLRAYSNGVQVYGSEITVTDADLTAVGGAVTVDGIYGWSYGIYTNGAVTIQEDAWVDAYGGDYTATAATADYAQSVGICQRGLLTIDDATVTAGGGTVTITGGIADAGIDLINQACSGGVWSRGMVLEDGAELTATGGNVSTHTVNYDIAISEGVLTFYDDTVIRDAVLTATGGTADGEEEGVSVGFVTNYAGFKMVDADAKVTLTSGAGRGKAQSSSNGICIVVGDLDLKAGVLIAASGERTNAPLGDAHAVFVKAADDENGDPLDGDLIMAEGMTIAVPEQGKIRKFTDTAPYYTIVDADGGFTKSVVFESKTAAYDIWVGDVQVTAENRKDVLSTADGDSSTVTYDPVTNTLTLNGATISNGDGIKAESDLTIKGTGTITGSTYGIHTGGMLEISEDTTITLNGGTAAVVNGHGYGSTDIIITVPENGEWSSTEDMEDGYNAYGTSAWDENEQDNVFTPAKTVKFEPGYVVSFDVDESTDWIDSQEVVKGGKAVKPADPTLSGYIFGGWYTDAACTTAYDFTTAVTGDITLYAKWTQRSSGGGSSSSNTTTKTEKNEDGSTTTTTTKKSTGTVTETTKYPDGSSTTVETKKDGTVTTTGKTADGVTGVTKTNADGTVTEVTAAVPSAAAKDAEKAGEAVTLPINVEAADDADEAAEIDIDVPSGGAKLEIPVEDMTPGTVIVIVNKDGTEEIVKTSTVSDTGVVVTLDKDATVKVIDNSKQFVDVHPVDHWAADAVDFVVAREIYSGTSATTFHPDNTMTRGMLAVVLHRLENTPDHNYTDSFTDVAEDSWYEDAIHWAADNGIVGGYGNGLYGPNDNITREQLAVMLWRYAGSPDSSHGLSHLVDEDQISNYARVALAWANENGIINGKGNNILDPKGNATRAQVAQMLKNFIENIM